MHVVNESGLYAVILRSDKPQAKPFRKWVTGDVLPSIRQTGVYSLPSPSTGPQPVPAELPPVPLITARMIARSTGQSIHAVLMQLKRHTSIEPVAFGYRPSDKKGQVTPLYLLQDVAAFYAANEWPLRVPFQPYSGLGIWLGSGAPIRAPRPAGTPALPSSSKTEAARLLMSASEQLAQAAQQLARARLRGADHD